LLSLKFCLGASLPCLLGFQLGLLPLQFGLFSGGSFLLLGRMNTGSRPSVCPDCSPIMLAI
jgi:hypothetical protein